MQTSQALYPYRTTAARIQPADMSLLQFCLSCGGKCCAGRTLVTDEERQRIVNHTGHDHLVRWRDDIYFLDYGVCPYLDHGLCSVQEVKPFVCMIFPYVPRVVDGDFWLFCVAECDVSCKLPAGFTEKAKALAQDFFFGRDPHEYEAYWEDNKKNSFNDSRVVFKVKVYEDSNTL